MKRITTDNVCEMGIVGLAHNCCYIGKDGYARYRDFDMDIDARELAKELLKELAKQDVDFESDGDFDEWIGDRYGEDGIGTIHGLIAMFYQNIWSMAELREKLKRYEDLEEQGRLLVLPCKVGDTALVKDHAGVPLEMQLEAPDIRFVCTDEDNLCMATCNRKPNGFCAYRIRNDGSDIGKTVFLTREEAEAALERMEEEK